MLDNNLTKRFPTITSNGYFSNIGFVNSFKNMLCALALMFSLISLVYFDIYKSVKF